MKKTVNKTATTGGKSTAARKSSTRKPSTGKTVTRKRASKKTRATPITTISAHIDVGFGNSLYLRGEGPGLSWERGVLMNCVADDVWTYSIEGTELPVVFKCLINDTDWCIGDDYLASAGKDIRVEPTF